MDLIADADALGDDARLLAQHQAAITLLQARLAAPGLDQFRWLDLGCGRGQILRALNDALSAEARGLVDYVGYDADLRFARETERLALEARFKSAEVAIGDLSAFTHVVKPPFDFVTFTNTAHELQPTSLTSVLLEAVRYLSASGTLFVYDLERIHPPELGAVPWRREEIQVLVRVMLDALGAADYRPEVGRWQHRLRTGWSVQIDRQHVAMSVAEFEDVHQDVLTQLEANLSLILVKKLDSCRSALESLTRHGAQTAEEEEGKVDLLFEFWALTRVAGAVQ